VSPGKTWEGLVGGLLAGASVALLCSAPLALRPRERLLFVFVCVVTVLFSVLGDLFESLVKRQAGVKDSGRLLPGHGGLLDRIDSLTAAAPVFALGMVVVGVPL
jgi:phosphatidate cytidylyltransferase